MPATQQGQSLLTCQKLEKETPICLKLDKVDSPTCLTLRKETVRFVSNLEKVTFYLPDLQQIPET